MPDKRSILFVCTGNVCRSPMAAAIFRELVGASGGWRVESAGTGAIDGLPASVAAVDVMHEVGIDITAHRSRLVTAELVDAAYMLVVMTNGHRFEIVTKFPVAADKVYLLKSLGNEGDMGDIADPIGASVAVYRRTRDEIKAQLPGLQAFLEKTLGLGADDQVP